jgi:putative flippase GtrA
VVANATDYAAGVAISFSLARQWSFRRSRAWFGASARVVAVLALAYAANLAAVLCVIGWPRTNSYVGQVLGVPVYAGFSYIGLRCYVFPETGKALEPLHDPSGRCRPLL